MRNRSDRLRRVAAVGAVLAVALGTGVSGAAGAAAAPAEDAEVVNCLRGFVCLQVGLSSSYRLAEGQRLLTGGLEVTEATNLTSIDYCVTGTFSYRLVPGETQTTDSRVRYVAPMPAGGACPA